MGFFDTFDNMMNKLDSFEEVVKKVDTKINGAVDAVEQRVTKVDAQLSKFSGATPSSTDNQQVADDQQSDNQTDDQTIQTNG